jgi:ATP-dependent DNA helicase RecQ
MVQYNKTLDSIKNNDVGLYDLVKLVNVKIDEMKLILKDLEDNGNIECFDNRHYNFIKEMTKEEFDLINQYKQIREEDLEKMLDYVQLKDCRTKFICEYLNDNSVSRCNHCDNCTEPLHIELSTQDYELLKSFLENYFIYEKTELCEIVASGYYKMEGVGDLIKNSKYCNKGYFHEKLLYRVLRAYNKYYKDRHFDKILFVPPTNSGDLVENFAQRISSRINVPFSKDLVKIKDTEIPLKEVKSVYKKRALIKGIFKVENEEEYRDKSILLIDDIVDSGVTIEEIANLLKSIGVRKICVLAIAKTTVGDE